jgi:hypothetical protein
MPTLSLGGSSAENIWIFRDDSDEGIVSARLLGRHGRHKGRFEVRLVRGGFAFEKTTTAGEERAMFPPRWGVERPGAAGLEGY